MKSIKDCLNVIDGVIIENIWKSISIPGLEKIRKCFLENGQSDFIEDNIALSNVLSQINCITENHDQLAEKDKKI